MYKPNNLGGQAMQSNMVNSTFLFADNASKDDVYAFKKN